MIKRKTTAIIIAIVVVAGVGIMGKKLAPGSGKTAQTLAPSVTSGNKVAVKTQKANETEVTANMSFKATLEASGEGIVSNKVGGKVVQVLIDDGKAVAKDDPLVMLDDSDIKNNIESSEAQLEASQAQLKSVGNQLDSAQMGLDNAQKSYDRTKALFDQGAVSKVELENAETALKTAKISVDSANLSIEAQKANIKTAQTNLETLQSSLNNTVVKAPISGITSDKSISVGQYVNVGTTLGKVENISPIIAVINVQQSDLNNIKVGQKAQFKLNEGDTDVYDGTVKSIDVSADPSSRVFKCKIQIDNEGQKLKPGIMGSIEIYSEDTRKAILLPLGALGGSQGKYYVFVNDKGVARKHTVTTGEVTKDSVEIKSGIQAGDEAITTNVSTLLDGDVVTVISK